MAEEILDIINEKNEVIGKCTRGEAHRNGILHRDTETFVFAGGKIVVEKRSKSKKTRPGHYAIVGETVKAGESFKEASERGVLEELGLKAVKTRELGRFFLSDKKYNFNELIAVFVCEGKGELKIDRNEVESVQLLSPNEVEALIKKGGKISPALYSAFEFFKREAKW